MELLIDALVFVLQLALAGFVVWGGLIAWRARYIAGHAAAAAPAREPKAEDFERAVSLVLLALLFTNAAS